MKKIKLMEGRNGITIQQQAGVSAQRRATDPAFERTRQHNAEFAKAGKAAILFCDAFRLLLAPSVTKGAYARLQGLFSQVIKLDPTNNRGERTVTPEALEMLKAFRWNETVRLKSTLQLAMVPEIDQAAGMVRLSIPEFIPTRRITPPPTATHVRLAIGAAAIDFEKEVVSNAYAYSDYLPLTSVPIPAFSLEAGIPQAGTHPLFVTLAMEFYEKVNTFMNDIKSRAFNALDVVAVLPRP